MSTPTEAPAREAAEAAPAAELTYREAINAALHDALAADDTVLLMGEDVGADGGVFKTNAGLIETFGAERVRTTPICENGFLGVALGMSLVGLRPIVEIMFADFLPTAGDALVNQLPKYRYMSGGQTSVPVTIRSISGGTGRFGTQHSATGESWFMQPQPPPVRGPSHRRTSASASGGVSYAVTAAIREKAPEDARPAGVTRSGFRFAGARFKEMDKDNDGKLSATELNAAEATGAGGDPQQGRLAAA